MNRLVGKQPKKCPRRVASDTNRDADFTGVGQEGGGGPGGVPRQGIRLLCEHVRSCFGAARLFGIPSVMSILLGIAVLFGLMFAMFSGVAGRETSARVHPRLTLRSRVDGNRRDAKIDLLLDGAGFEPDSQVRFIAWHLPDGNGFYHSSPVESARPCKLRGGYFEDVAFEPAITLAVYSGEGEPHDIKVIASDDHGNAAEAWISGKDFYLKKESSIVR